jgi:hypothetical protein
MREAFKVLGLEIPKIKGSDQAEVNRKLKVWKNTELKAAYRAKAKEEHPDTNGEDPDAGERFKAVRAAFEQIRDDLRINLRKPPPPPPPKSEATSCPTCSTKRIPDDANFCYNCGAPYNMDALERRLLDRGITKATVEWAKRGGLYTQMQALPPMSPQLRDEIELLFHKQRLGLIGKYSPFI